ncbi:MAG: DUF4339 domain-containing protein [Planctomycetota bacterium]|nr:DUF4339 domain-containing protein [Planctomycetota bacterium]
MKHAWYCMIEKRKLGPMDWDQLIELSKSGKLNSETPVWRIGMSAWAPLDDVIKSAAVDADLEAEGQPENQTPQAEKQPPTRQDPFGFQVRPSDASVSNAVRVPTPSASEKRASHAKPQLSHAGKAPAKAGKTKVLLLLLLMVSAAGLSIRGWIQVQELQEQHARHERAIQVDSAKVSQPPPAYEPTPIPEFFRTDGFGLLDTTPARPGRRIPIPLQ